MNLLNVLYFICCVLGAILLCTPDGALCKLLDDEEEGRMEQLMRKSKRRSGYEDDEQADVHYHPFRVSKRSLQEEDENDENQPKSVSKRSPQYEDENDENQPKSVSKRSPHEEDENYLESVSKRSLQDEQDEDEDHSLAKRGLQEDEEEEESEPYSLFKRTSPPSATLTQNLQPDQLAQLTQLAKLTPVQQAQLLQQAQQAQLLQQAQQAQLIQQAQLLQFAKLRQMAEANKTAVNATAKAANNVTVNATAIAKANTTVNATSTAKGNVTATPGLAEVGKPPVAPAIQNTTQNGSAVNVERPKPSPTPNKKPEETVGHGGYSGCDIKDHQEVLDTLPGSGWDNLRNLDMGQVLQLTYNRCTASENRKYLLPDGVLLKPIQSSRLPLSGEVFHSYREYTSMTAQSINVDYSDMSFSLGVSGAFSKEYMEVKANNLRTKSVCTRVAVRYDKYDVKFQPAAVKLSPEFINRLSAIGQALREKRSAYASYLAELIIRDFGTHYVRSIVAGAALVKIDHLKDKKQDNPEVLNIGPPAVFKKFFHLKTEEAEDQDHRILIKQYEDSIAQVQIFTIGGASYEVSGINLQAWEKSVDHHLVAIDRQGEFLYTLVTPEMFTAEPENITYMIRRVLKQSTMQYYVVNMHPGCMDLHSPDFDPYATVHDPTKCISHSRNYFLGGIFQRCHLPKDGFGLSACLAREQKNQLTGNYTCLEGFLEVLLMKAHIEECEKTCRHAYTALAHRKKAGDPKRLDECYARCATVETYWCAPANLKKGVKSKGYLFGGIYSQLQNLPNPVTDSYTCPRLFHEVKFGLSGSLCVSTNEEVFEDANIFYRFGGFYGCKSQNPYADRGQSGCPPGYLQHHAYTDNDCEVLYCIQKHRVVKSWQPTRIRRPPFKNLHFVQGSTPTKPGSLQLTQF